MSWRWCGPYSLSTKLSILGVAMLVAALASISATLWITRQIEGGAAAVNEAGRLRMQTWRLASAQLSHMPEIQIKVYVQQFDDSLQLLREGDPMRPLFVPWDEQVRPRFERLYPLWRTQRQELLRMDASEQSAARVEAAAAAFVTAIDEFVWAIEQQLSKQTALLNLFQFVMMMMAIAGATVMLYIGYLFVIHPLSRLKQGLSQIEAGQFNERIEVDTRDEFGAVAEGFNRMASTLQSLYQGLESKVREKTQHIAAQNERLSALYEVSAFLGNANHLQDMAEGFVQQIRRISHSQAVALRWLDEAEQRYVLLASVGMPESLQKNEHCLSVGTCACGFNVAQHTSHTMRVIELRSIHPGPLGSPEHENWQHCIRSGFQTLIGIPVRLQHRVIGEIDIFYDREVVLTAEEKSLLDALAQHLGSAMEGLRASALEREAAVGEERTMLARELHDSIAQSLAFMRIQVQLLSTAVARGQKEKIEQIVRELELGVQESVNDVRELLVHFRTRTQDEDMEGALQVTLRKFEHQTGLATHLRMLGSGVPLLADVQVQVLHVIQEALSNVRKHAEATLVELEVQRGRVWLFSVRDNGRGFKAEHHPGEDHVGLHIMRERAARIGATLQVHSQVGGGTTIELHVPSQGESHSDSVALVSSLPPSSSSSSSSDSH